MDSDSLTNKSLQNDEIDAMSSIFYPDWQLEDPFKMNSYSIKISNSSGNSVFFKVILPEDYPLNSPPQYVLSAPWMSREVKNRLAAMLEDIYSENAGNCILYEWVLQIKDFINGELTKDNNCDDSKSLVDHEDANASILPLDSATELLDNFHLPCNDEELPPITHGEIIEDRKSVFQGHVAKAVSDQQVRKILSKLKETRKIAIATHNIFAYRISTGPTSFIQESDDDGEAKAGYTLLELLQKLDVQDVVVVVSRWYGGVHLGPDRFKHIKCAARSALLAAGFVQEKTKGCEKKH